MTRSLMVAAALFTTLASSTAFADEQDKPQTEHVDRPVGAHVASSVQLNPTVLKTEVGVRYRYALSHDEEGTRSYLQAGAGLSATPSYVAPSAHVEARFGRTFALRAEYAYLHYVSNDRGLIPFASKDADFSASALDRREPLSGGTHKITLTPQGTLQLGPMLVKMKNDISYMRTPEIGEAFYIPDYDLLVRRDDVVAASRTDGLFTAWRGAGDAALRMGPSLQSTWALRTNIQRMRVGATVGYTPAESVAIFVRPTIGVDAGVNVRDENRAGEAYAAMALSTEF